MLSTTATTTAARYGEMTVYGPFHRLWSSTQSVETMRKVLRSGELWGRAPRYGLSPAVQAYAGRLPDGKQGFEFFAAVPPDRPFGPQSYWRARLDGGVRGDHEWAKLRVVLSRVSQES